MQICGGVLPFEHETAEAFLEAWHGFEKLSEDEKREFAREAVGADFDDEAVADLSLTEMLRASSSMFTTFWLVDLIDQVQDPAIPELRNAEGEELVLCKVRYPFATGTSADGIRAILEARPEFPPASSTSWNWVSLEEPAKAPRDTDEQPQESLTFETWHENGALVRGNVERPVIKAA